LVLIHGNYSQNSKQDVATQGRHNGWSARKHVDVHVKTKGKYLSYLIPEMKYDALTGRMDDQANLDGKSRQ
jgi:hypothetical protein